VSGLAAAPDAVQPDRVLLQWTEPDGNGGTFFVPQTVATYEVRYATYSIASVGGDPNVWWSGASATVDTPPAPGTPGDLIAMVVTGLNPNTQYWFAVKSRDNATPPNVSFIDLNAQSIVSQAQAVTRPINLVRPAPVLPQAVAHHANGTVTVQWPAVTLNENGAAATDITGYRVYRATSPFGPFTTLVATSAVGAPAVTLAPHASQSLYYAVVARNGSGLESRLSATNYVRVGPDGTVDLGDAASNGARGTVEVNDAALPEMNAAGGVYVRLRPFADPSSLPDTARTIGTYRVGFEDRFGAPATLTTLSRPLVTVTLPYHQDGVADPATERVGVLWWNGVAWIKMGRADVDAARGTVSVRTGLTGAFQVRTFEAATELSLDRSSVFPRIFSPNGDGINDRVFFLIDNPRLVPVQGRIIDLSGGDVSDLRPAGAGAPSADALAWDGRDRAGQIVPAGVYLYEVKGDGKAITGSVVVAK
jgi:hypothetical protein